MAGPSVSTAVLVPGPLAERVQAILGQPIRSATAAVGGHSNFVFIVGDAIVKAASAPIKRADVAREIQLIRAIDGLGCSAPTMIGSSVDDEWSVLATIKSAGTPGPVNLSQLQADPSAAAGFGTLMGRLLRTVHGCAPHPASGALFERTGLLADAGARLGGLEISSFTQATLAAAIAHPVHAQGVAFLHGDPGLHNVMLDIEHNHDGTRLRIAALVDWELGGWGNALSDLSWLYWTLWFRGLDAHAWPSFVDTYGPWALRALGWSAESVRACVLGQMAVLLVRTDASTAVRDVWLDRINSLETMHIPDVPA